MVSSQLMHLRQPWMFCIYMKYVVNQYISLSVLLSWKGNSNEESTLAVDMLTSDSWMEKDGVCYFCMTNRSISLKLKECSSFESINLLYFEGVIWLFGKLCLSLIAFAILRDSVSTSRVSLGEQDNVAPGLLEGNSEGIKFLFKATLIFRFVILMYFCFCFHHTILLLLF